MAVKRSSPHRDRRGAASGASGGKKAERARRPSGSGRNISSGTAAPKVGLARSGARPQNNRRHNPEAEKKRGLRIKIPDFPWRGVGSVLGWLLTIGLCLIFFGGLGFGLVKGYNYFTSSQYFALKTIELNGLYRLDSREILETLGLNEGVNTLALSIDEMEQTLARNPWVAELSVKRSLPDKFSITVKEREPKFWMMKQGSLFYADGHGNPIAPVAQTGFASLPTLEVEPGAEIYTGRLPDLVRGVSDSVLFDSGAAVISWLRLDAAGIVELKLENNQVLLAIGLDDWNGNLWRMGVALRDMAERGELARVKSVTVYGNKVWAMTAPQRY